MKEFFSRPGKCILQVAASSKSSEDCGSNMSINRYRCKSCRCELRNCKCHRKVCSNFAFPDSDGNCLRCKHHKSKHGYNYFNPDPLKVARRQIVNRVERALVEVIKETLASVTQDERKQITDQLKSQFGLIEYRNKDTSPSFRSIECPVNPGPYWQGGRN